jgi:hypothetical protein
MVNEERARRKRSLLSHRGMGGRKTALNFWFPDLPIWSEKSAKKKVFSVLSSAAKGKIVFHMDTHIIMIDTCFA